MTFIEVFTEDGCACSRDLLQLVERFASGKNVAVRVYERSTHPEEFSMRGVVICPATCIDGKLAFYGEIAQHQFEAMIASHNPR